MFELICNGLFTLLGVFIGWFLNQVSSVRQARPRLCFCFCNTSKDELIEKELRTKTSASDYGIEIYNVGQSPFIKENCWLIVGLLRRIGVFSPTRV